MEAINVIKEIGVIASIALPLFNIPLILKIRRRGSSKDFSLTWTLGVWFCLILMIPAVLISHDIVFKVFGIINFTLFTAVVVYVLKYR
ncbi:MAG TPA: hypothetical protein QF468_05345 [Nitrospinota bacterium]|nr:hypothetical protein [Nitrospinota bacterium]